jgi:lipid-A-disaccharide synthase
MKPLYIIAGEPSGDLLGASLMAHLRQVDPHILFEGIGGPQMEALGLQSLFPIEDISVMGFGEVLRHLPRIYKRFHETIDHIKKVSPQALITIDCPSFSLKISKKFKGYSFPLIHYTAPSVWAWRPGRAKEISSFLDHLMCLLPFEPPYFTCHGLRASFVGHPLADKNWDLINPLTHKDLSAKDDDGLKGFPSQGDGIADPLRLVVLPGSRNAEVERMAPLFRDAILCFQEIYPHPVQVICPCFDRFSGFLDRIFSPWNPVIITDKDDRYRAMKTGDLALGTSGTVILELALMGIPTISAYDMNPLSRWIARKLVKIPHATLPNILLSKAIVPEFLLENAQPSLIAQSMVSIIQNKKYSLLQRSSSIDLLNMLRPLEGSSGKAAASCVLKILKEKSSNMQDH